MYWNDVESWISLNGYEALVLFSSEQEMSQEVIDVKFKELDNLKDKNVFEEVEFKGQQTVVSSRWIVTEKDDEGKRKVKARLVARGFEEDCESLGIRTDSPTCNKYSLRLVMNTTACYNWAINSIDIDSAFLQGNDINRKLYLRPPKEFCPADRVWRLKRCIYGLKDAPREWNTKVIEEMMKLGAVRCSLDNAMFTWYENGELIGLAVTHVDDFIYCGTTNLNDNVISTIKRKFNKFGI